jgi:hypothetical protein
MPFLPTFGGIRALKIRGISVNYFEIILFVKELTSLRDKAPAGAGRRLVDPRLPHKTRANLGHELVRGRAWILSRGLWLNVGEGGHGTFVRFFHRRDAERAEKTSAGDTENGNFLDSGKPLECNPDVTSTCGKGRSQEEYENDSHDIPDHEPDPPRAICAEPLMGSPKS